MNDEKNQKLQRISNLLVELYGPKDGDSNYRTLLQALDSHLASIGVDDQSEQDVAGKVFAISYPDNVYDDAHPTLQTLENVLSEHFPNINGIHILPERPMSHNDIWPQDLFEVLSPEHAADLITYLQECNILDNRRQVTHRHADSILTTWLKQRANSLKVSALNLSMGEISQKVQSLLDRAYSSHFNDGGFSQLNRSMVDPRFGTVDDIRRLSERHAIMLDYVVNHLDVDNDVLEGYRRGENDGSAFIILTPDIYRILSQNGTIARTFRPRPFPLFTGMRMYPSDTVKDRHLRIDLMNRHFVAHGLGPLDTRLVEFLAIHFKVENDQGLSAEDGRVLDGFLEYLEENRIDQSALFRESTVQPQQLMFCKPGGIESCLTAIGVDPRYGWTFLQYDDQVYGEKFFVYTTFSESQVDINPASQSGFAMVVGDLFSLIGSGNLAMLRMDAIKYLWKEVGRKNFDLDEGNKLIEVIRLLLSIASPELLPLDEVNSPDPVVYEMGREGGFAYLFGQVNSIPAAFNAGTLEPIKRFRETMEKKCPANLLLFAMLSTHDGRSVQGLGVDRTDGHVSIAQFYDLLRAVADRGGKPKYRSVQSGEIPADTLQKVAAEAGIAFAKLTELFSVDEDVLRLSRPIKSREQLLEAVAGVSGRTSDELSGMPAIDFFLQWVVGGRTPYELCCTSRSAFLNVKPDGVALNPREEALRLALAQIYVLTLGQIVPAIYFNDLLGLENDTDGFNHSGKPRDLNRHKNYMPEMDEYIRNDEFGSTYVPLINAAVKARVEDTAFLPGSPDFEFRALSDTVFLNHPFARGTHSFIVGNIVPETQSVVLYLPELSGVDNDAVTKLRTSGLQDVLTDTHYAVSDSHGTLTISLGPYAALWLVPAE